MSTQAPAALPVQFEDIPPELMALDRWVLWRYVQRTKPDGSKVWAKMPVQADGSPASSTNPATWTTFDEAADTFILGGFQGLGFVLGTDIHGIDLDDCRDPATGELSELAQEVLQRVDGYAEVSPSGTGIKVFTRSNLDGSRTKKELGIELYREGRYFTVTGHGLNGHCALPADTQDVGWLVQRAFGEPLRGSTQAVAEAASDLALANYKPPLEDWDLDRVVDEVLPHLDPDCGYEEWLRVGAAMHHQGQGDEEWLQAWDEWSQGSSKWAEGYCEAKWRSFSEQRASGHGALTLASLLKATKAPRQEAAVEARQELLQELLDQVQDCTDARPLQDHVAAQAANSAALTDIERAALAKAIVTRAKALGAPVPMGTVRGWVRCRVRSAQPTSAPAWASEWVYVTDGDKFLNLATKEEVTAQGFRARFNRQMPMNQDGSRERADQAALELWGTPTVAHKSYMPGAGPTFEMFGLQWANLYRPESVPQMPEQLSQEEMEAIELVEQHLQVYLADERERQLLLSWLAHNVQHPGVKIRWAPYVHGVPGDGKSFFAELVAVAMGGQNVRSLNGSTLESNFTDWAAGYALVAIEEMKQHGHNRYDVMNRLKPFITNSQVEIHPKGKASYTAPNVSNYIVFSNYLDGAPVDEGDRRYMFLSSQLTTDKAKKLTEEGYFTNLFNAVRQHPGAMRKWLMGVSMHPDFDANGRAPDTEIKRTVVEMSKTDFHTLAEDVLDEGALGVTPDVISSPHLVQALANLTGGEKPATNRINTLLTHLGFTYWDRKKWRGKPCRIWVRAGAGLKAKQVMERLDQSANAALDFLE